MSKVIDQDNNFIAYKDWIVYDEKTGLEWYVGPDKDTTWDEAKEWVESLDVDGSKWRLPKLKELKSLYQGEESEGERNITFLLETSGWFIWSEKKVKKDSATVWVFNLHFGEDYWDHRLYSLDCRVFAVRSRKKSE